VCARKKKKRQKFSPLSFLRLRINIYTYLGSTYRLLLRIGEIKYDERVIHEDNKSGENEIGEKAQ